MVPSLSLWLAQSLAELAPGLIVKRFFDALQQQAYAQAGRSVLLLLVFAAGFAGIVMATAVASARLRFHIANETAARRLARLDEERGRWAIRDQLLERSIRAAFAATSAIGSGLVLAVAGGAMRTGEFSVGDFALFAYYLTFLAEFSAEFGGLLLQYRQAQVSWRRIGALSGTRHRGHWSDTARPFRRDEPATRIRATEDRAESSIGSGRLPSSVAASAAADGPEPLRELRLSGLCVSRPPRGIAQDGPALRVLDGISLTFRRGELVAVTGRVGAGKTTLLKALLGLVPVESGAILWNGGVVRDPGTWFRYPVCTYVPQEPHLFSVPSARTSCWSRARARVRQAGRSMRRYGPPFWRATSRACRMTPRQSSARRERSCRVASGSGWRRRARSTTAPRW